MNISQHARIYLALSTFINICESPYILGIFDVAIFFYTLSVIIYIYFFFLNNIFNIAMIIIELFITRRRFLIWSIVIGRISICCLMATLFEELRRTCDNNQSKVAVTHESILPSLYHLAASINIQNKRRKYTGENTLTIKMKNKRRK